MNKSENVLEKIERLSGQRSVRTDRLHDAVKVLLGQLESLVHTGESWVIFDGSALYRSALRSNVGEDLVWTYDAGDRGLSCTDLERPVDFDGYLHGDFDRPVSGPSRGTLLHFATRAAAFVGQIAADMEEETADLAAAVDSVESIQVPSAE